MALLRPPCGWSTGFLATPLVIDFLPIFLKKPPLVILIFFLTLKATCPGDANEYIENIFLTPEGNLTSPVPVLESIFIVTAFVPTDLAYWMPRPGAISNKLIGWFFFNCRSTYKVCGIKILSHIKESFTAGFDILYRQFRNLVTINIWWLDEVCTYITDPEERKTSETNFERKGLV